MNKTEYIPEDENSDSIFNARTHNHIGNLSKDKEYKHPAIKVWYYTNVHDLSVWIEHEGYPTKVPYNINVFPKVKFKEGVYIIKSYTIRKDSKDSLYAINKLLISDKLNLTEASKVDVINYCNKIINGKYLGEHLSLRFVDFIPIVDIDKNEVLNMGSYKLSTNLEDFYKDATKTNVVCPKIEVPDNVYSSNSLVLNIRMTSAKHKHKTYFIKDTPITIGCMKSLGNEDVHISTIKPCGSVVDLPPISMEEFDACGLLRNTNSSSEQFKNHDAFVNSATKYTDSKIKALGDRNKLLADTEVSYHKLIAFALNTKTAELKLDKEMSGLFRDLLKTVSGLV